MDPDGALFEVQMSETSSAEEEQIKEALDTGADIVDKMMSLVLQIDPDLDKIGLFNYFSEKILKLNDLDLKDYKRTGEVRESKAISEIVRKRIDKILGKRNNQYPISNLDLKAYLPLDEKTEYTNEVWVTKTEQVWREKFGKMTVQVREHRVKKKKKD